MKFSNVLSFDKHLKEAYHTSSIFLIAIPCDYERKLSIDKLKKLISAPSVQLLEPSVEQIKSELLSPNLWGGARLIVVESADKVKNIEDILDHPLPPEVHLILSSKSFKPLSDFYQKGKKDITVLDLTEEKPWEKERRLQEWLFEKARAEQKKVSSEAVTYLLTHLGPDLAMLDQEFNKLLCYVGNKPRIELEDVKAICGSQDLFTGWQLAEKIIWQKPSSLGTKQNDLNFIFPFIGQLRYHLQLGYKLTELNEGDLKRHFPTVRNVNQLFAIAKTRKSFFFHQGLQALYDFEFASKSSALDLGTLFDRFQAKLYENPLPTS